MNKRQRKKALKKLQTVTRCHFTPVYVKMIFDPRWSVLGRTLHTEPKAAAS